MRIALLAPPWYTVPPRGYGGVELLLGGLADGLVARGHEVMLISAGANGTLARGHRTLPDAAPDRLGNEVTSLLHASLAEDALRDFRADVVSDHTLPGLLAAERRGCPTVVTVHGPPRGEYGELLRRSRACRLVAISESQRRSAPDMAWWATVRNGIAVRGYPVGSSREDYLLFLGRMHPDKGVAQAIEVAEKSGSRLLIAARLHGHEEEQYFETVVRPRLSSRIEFIGEVGYTEKVRLLSGARGLLFPLQWDEPYGLVVAEAQACGAPVLSLRRGAIPELVVHGRTGWLRDHHDELVADVERLDLLSPGDCRAHALEALDIAVAVKGYESAFSAAAEAGSTTLRGRVPVVPSRSIGADLQVDLRSAVVDGARRVPRLMSEETP